MDLKTLCELNGASGDEHAVRKAILTACRLACDDVHIDRSGNVIAHKQGASKDSPRVALAAHMDEVGFIVVGHTEDGLLRFRPIGGIDPRVIVSKWVALGDVKGVIGAKAIHLQSPQDRETVLDYKGLYIDIGAKDKAEAERLCPIGTYAYFDVSFEPFGEGMVVSKALDDRVGCYNLLRILQNDYDCDLTVCFVTNEEVGLRGSAGAAFAAEADIAVILEGTSANDMGDIPERFKVCSVNQGVAVSFMDRASIADRKLFKEMLAIAKEQEIPHQGSMGITGGNDAASFQRAKKGCRTVVLSVPCRYIHSSSSVCSLNDVDAQYALLDAFLKSREVK